MEEIFYKYPEKLMRASAYKSPLSGELIELTANDKNVYVIMKKRNSFFDKHFDKQSDIASLVSLSVKQTGRIMRSFIDNGVFDAHKGSSGQHRNFRYEGVKPLELFVYEGEGKSRKVVYLGVVEEGFWKTEKKSDKKVNEWRGGSKPNPVKQPPVIEYDPWDESQEDELPF